MRRRRRARVRAAACRAGCRRSTRRSSSLLNVMLAIEVVLVFASTMVRTLLQLVGADGRRRDCRRCSSSRSRSWAARSPYSRGQFIAITLLVDRAPRAWNGRSSRRLAEWIVIVVSLLIGGYSVPLLIANAEEKTILLGIGYAWMTMPITARLGAVRRARRLRRCCARPGARSLVGHSPSSALRRCCSSLLQPLPRRASARCSTALLGVAVLRADRRRRAGRLRARARSASRACRRSARPT